jgi:tetratricopeptide (TPR) repeat protein
MTNQFHNSGDGEQNVAQGDGAIGKQEKVTQEVRGDGNISSGSGNVTVNLNQGIPPEVFAEYAGKLGTVMSALDNFFDMLEEEKASPRELDDRLRKIAKQYRQVQHTYNMPSPSEVFVKCAKELGVTKLVVNSFFNTLLKQELPLDQWDSKLREIAATYKELLARLETVQPEDPEVVRLKEASRQAIEAGDYAGAEEPLNQAETRDLQAIEELEQAIRQRRISAAANYADSARLQHNQGNLAKAEQHISRAVQLAEEIGHPKLEEWREVLEDIRAKLRGR